MREEDLYPPIKAHFEGLGYHIRAEVKDCDVVAVKEDEIIVIELKTQANMTLLIQATERQTITSMVYVALPEPRRRNRHFRGVIRILRRLGLGLLLVRFGPLGPSVSLECSASGTNQRKSAKRRLSVLNEFRGRSGDYNTAGASRVQVMTAYKEAAIFIACCLEQLGPSSARALKALGSGDKTSTILQSDYYGWFERVERGVYRITQRGVEEVAAYPGLRHMAIEKIRDLTDSS
ncbi:MAG: DUF2161 family putative PD-(D/E)XK-type phosphodiesterase [Pseudomonadales bacterium]